MPITFALKAGDTLEPHATEVDGGGGGIGPRSGCICDQVSGPIIPSTLNPFPCCQLATALANASGVALGVQPEQAKNLAILAAPSELNRHTQHLPRSPYSHQ